MRDCTSPVRFRWVLVALQTPKLADFKSQRDRNTTATLLTVAKFSPPARRGLDPKFCEDDGTRLATPRRSLRASHSDQYQMGAPRTRTLKEWGTPNESERARSFLTIRAWQRSSRETDSPRGYSAVPSEPICAPFGS